MRVAVPTFIIPGHDAAHATAAARYLQECLPQSTYWDAAVEAQTEAPTNPRVLAFCAACSYNESMDAYTLGRDVSRSIIAVIRTIVLRLFAGRRFGGALPFGQASPVAQANDVIGIGGLCVRDRFDHDAA